MKDIRITKGGCLTQMPSQAESASKTSSSVMLRVGLVLLKDFTLTAFGGFVDSLRLAADEGGQSRQIHASWKIMTPGAQPRMASCGLHVTEVHDLLEPCQFDYIAVCGGNSYNDRTPTPEVESYLREAHSKNIRILGICTGTFVIARAGLLEGRTVCVHWNVRDVFQKQFPRVRTVTDRIFMDEGDLITCAGSTAAIDLGLYLVSRHCGRERAQQAIRHMMLMGIRASSLPQASFQEELGSIVNPRIRKAVHFMEQHLDHSPKLSAVARYVGISTRQLERVFKTELGTSPSRFYRMMRLKYGQWMVENRLESITQIAVDCGYSDTAHFSREFKNHFGVSPRQYRQNRKSVSGSD